jgi:3-oxoacyl-[acyl-carrier protein] reductase
MNLGLHGKVALVTAASKGLGRACALALAAEGAQVMIAARHQEALFLTAREIEERTGSRIRACPADVSKREDLETLVTNTLEAFGGIDILVHNTGGPSVGTFAEVTDTQWQAAFETELLSAVRLVRLTLPCMRQRGGGRIMHIVSTSVKQPSEGLILANAIRPGLVMLAKTLALDLAPEHITVNTICPGRILTDRLRYGGGVRARMAQGMSEEQALQEMVQAIPMGRAGRPEEVGALVAFLASEQAAYITGTTMVIDGGFVRSIW